MPFLKISSLAALGTLALVACGSTNGNSLHGTDHDAGDAGSGGAKGSGGAAGTPASGGAVSAGGDGSDNSECHTSNLSSAPIPCLQDWMHATKKYPAECTTDVGGFQARCDPYDTIQYHSAGTYVWCYYDTATGNLIGARSTTEESGSGGTCAFFDVSFSEPALSTCTPVSCEGGAP